MKTKFLTFSLLCVSLVSAQAQVFRPEIVSGTALGAIAGAIIGNNSGGGNGAKGAAVGAASGLVLGAVAAQANDQARYGGTQVDVPRRMNDFSNGSRAVQGALLGGLTGAVIGNNSGRGNGAHGAVIGAATGLVLGSIADTHVRQAPAYGYRRPSYRPYYENYCEEPARVVVARPVVVTRYARPVYHARPVVVTRPVVVETVRTVPAPQQITIINNYYGSDATAMSGANGLFGR